MYCLLCSSRTKTHFGLCQPCARDLPRIGQHCSICALPLQSNQEICGQCIKKKPHYDSIITPCYYQDPLVKIISTFKFNQQPPLAKLLAHLLLTELQSFHQTNPLPDIIIPVPLHKKRLWTRGFNQAFEIAKPIAKKLAIPLNHKLCTRIKNTTPQHQLNAKQRRHNLKNAFIIDESINATHVALVDDIVTTGTTVNEISQLLRTYGFKHITVWCCARTK